MTLTQILADIYRRVGFASSPPSDVSTRITAFVNETQQEILREAGMQWLQNETLTFSSTANRQVYGIPVQADKLKTIRDATNSITLEPMSVEEYRHRYPDPSANTGLSTRWVDLGFDAVTQEPSDASTIYVDSTSGSDTGTAYLEGFLSNGQPFSVSVTMTGATAVAFSPTTVLNISKFYISANAVGTVTLHEDAEGGTELARIPAGFSHSRYRRIALVPTPSSAVTYNIDYEREVPDMSNGTDQPVLPQKFHYLLGLGARMKEYEKTNDMARWSLAKAEYAEGVRKLKFWIYQQTVGVPNMRGYAFSRPMLEDGGTLSQSSSTSSPHTAAEGGTGFSSYTIGDMLMADTTTSLAKLTAVADGRVLRAAGAGVVPAYSTFTITDTFANTRVPYATAANTLGSSANLTFDGTTLTVTGLSNTGNTTLGDAAADSVTVNGTVTSNIIFTDNTYDIGASGATRPRDLFLSRNATIAGSTTLNGAVTLGDAAGDNITVTGTLTSNLLFTDATYDIGASGATRPRDFFFSRNGTIGGTLGVTGVATFTAQSVHNAGIDLSGASSGQIVFPATQNASTNVNTLDDYEEGTWTPVIGGAGGTSGQVYATQVGRYVKIGKQVIAYFSVELSTEGTITGNAQIQGLPFATETLSGMFFTSAIVWFGLPTNWVSIMVQAGSNVTAAEIVGAAAAAATNGTNLTATDIDDSCGFRGCLVYRSAN